MHIIIKQGDTFYPLLSMTEADGTPASLEGVVVESKARAKNSKVVAFELSEQSRDNAAGTLQFAPIDTANLAPGDYLWDLRITSNNVVAHTDTKTISVQEAVT